MIDMHCHLDLYPDPYSIASECKKRNIYVLSVTTIPSAWEGTVRLGEGSSRIKTALGLHPQLAGERYGEVGLFRKLLPRTKYVGEIGLDGSKAFKDTYERQCEVFDTLLKHTEEAGGRIMSIHSRGAVSDVLAFLNKYPDSGTPVFHWYTGNKTLLKEAVSIGGWFSVGPAMLSTKKGKDLLAEIPKNRVLTETDGPFAKYNKITLSPLDVCIAVDLLSKEWCQDREEVEQILLNNFRELLSEPSN